MATSWRTDFASEVVSAILDGDFRLSDVADLTHGEDPMLQADIIRALPMVMFLSDMY